MPKFIRDAAQALRELAIRLGQIADGVRGQPEPELVPIPVPVRPRGKGRPHR